MEFTDDPFRDYRYEDPFNIADPFADVEPQPLEPFGRSKSTEPWARGGNVTSGRASAPLSAILDEQRWSVKPVEAWGRAAATAPTASAAPEEQKFAWGSAAAPEDQKLAWGRAAAPEEQQLAWAARESLRQEQQDRQRSLQEQRDLELAIALSKQEQARPR